MEEGVRPIRWGCLVLVLALVIITGAVFGRVVANDFTWWDDHETIHQNPDLNPPSAEKITISPIIAAWRCCGSALRATEQTVG